MLLSRLSLQDFHQGESRGGFIRFAKPSQEHALRGSYAFTAGDCRITGLPNDVNPQSLRGSYGFPAGDCRITGLPDDVNPQSLRGSYAFTAGDCRITGLPDDVNPQSLRASGVRHP